MSTVGKNTNDKAAQFLGRDANGLMSEDKAKPEAEARLFYFKMIGALAGFWGPLLASALYWGTAFLFPGQATAVSVKLDFIRQHQLGYLYLTWFVVFLAKAYASINANGARAPARVDRPDQHVYQIMAESGPLAGSPYVMMTTTGAVGRFNRAQRACGNMDEGMPLFVSGLLLQGAVFGPLAACIATLYMYGSVRFANDYKVDPSKRIHGFMCAMIAQYLSCGLVTVVAFQTLLRPLLPF
uniref:Uncharacterized protein n=1 Tax=Tetraselmis chuii TaxID=63592 RepID=A0A7S1SKC4_9CHLO|mmetsp:Transcript_16903/g.30175  ORF Transcript_16903/g.30175 Transcript_16903/m.30175 type:complete len:240 (+) Transcript_16903:112-831(+)